MKKYSLSARIGATWRYFSVLRFPFMQKYDPENTPSPGRILTVLFGAFLSLLSIALLFLAGKISYTAQVFCGGVIVPLLLESICGGAGACALASFIADRQKGISFEEALHGAYSTKKRSFSCIFLLVMIWLFRAAMICALTVCGSYYFLTAALCGGYYVRAELSTVKVPGGKEFFDQGSENKKQYHGIVAFIIILAAAFLHSWNVTGALIAALTAWLIAWYGISLCTETEQGMSCNAQRVTGYGTEMILLLEGTLICFRG